MTKGIFISEVDGCVYRDGKRIRNNYMYLPKNGQVKSVRDMKAAIRVFDRAFGNTRMVSFMSDGEVMCYQCIKENFHNIVRAIADDDEAGGWMVLGVTSDNEIENEFCCNCGCSIGITTNEEDEEAPTAS